MIQPESTPVFLGFDVGQVLLEQTPETMAALFDGRYDDVAVVPGALETIAKARMAGKVVKIISYAGGDPVKEERVRCCLTFHGFLADGLLAKEDIFFTATKQEKGFVCRRLGIAQMVVGDSVCVNAVRKVGVPCIWFGQSLGPSRCADHTELQQLLGIG